MTPIIAFEHVHKAYGDKVVLDDFSLAIEKGAFVTIVGASGGGKTTVLKLVNGLLSADAGTIRVMGQDIRQADLIQLRRNIGYAIQGSVLFPHMSVAENIAYVPNLLNKNDKPRTKAAVDKWLGIVGLDRSLLARYPAELSGGQQQRVGIARALAARPEVLLCDEATSALDPETTASVLALLADINQRLNLTIVLITHQLEVVKTICDHAALLEQGEIVESGKLADLLVTPWSRLRQSLLHDPQAEQEFLTRHGVQGRPLCGVA